MHKVVLCQQWSTTSRGGEYATWAWSTQNTTGLEYRQFTLIFDFCKVSFLPHVLNAAGSSFGCLSRGAMVICLLPVILRCCLFYYFLYLLYFYRGGAVIFIRAFGSGFNVEYCP